jgi:putative pyruvate formate lyase activating enzyme
MNRVRPAYLEIEGEIWRERVSRAIGALADCRACPRDCGVNRLENRWSACKTGRHAVVSSCFPHFGEEDCLRGWNGSGTIFFAHCNLRCVFCQNYDISQDIRPAFAHGSARPRQGSEAGQTNGGGPQAATAAPRELAAMMLSLQMQGCHNINFVTPEHVVPQIVEAVAEAVQLGLTLPIVYNTSAYDSLDSIALMDGIADIYLPDFKYWSAERSKTYLKAEDYPKHARAAIEAMHEQVGPLVFDDDGLARRGVLIRHLVMPGCLDETCAILEWIAQKLGTETYVNLMDQYRPAGKVTATSYSEINRPLASGEFEAAWRIAVDLGLRLDRRRPHARLRRKFLL